MPKSKEAARGDIVDQAPAGETAPEADLDAIPPRLHALALALQKALDTRSSPGQALFGDYIKAVKTVN